MRIDAGMTVPISFDPEPPEDPSSIEASFGEREALSIVSPAGSPGSETAGQWLLAEAHHAATDVAQWAKHTWSSLESLWGRARAVSSQLEGTVGVSFPLGPTVVDLEAGQDAKHGFSATAGVTAAKIVKASVTIQDKDRDGKFELCGKAGVGSYKFEGCLENPFASG